MGRKSTMKSRPGLIFVGVLLVCLLIFYLSWRSVMVPRAKPYGKNVLKMHSARLASPLLKHEKNPFENSNLDIFSHRKKDVFPQQDKQSRFGIENIQIHEQDMSIPMKKASGNPFVKMNPTKNDEEIKKKMWPEKPWYREPDASIKDTVRKMEKLVHLDLKGAAPKVSYLKELFPFLTTLGATGLLLEYEDMFPYSGDLKGLASANAYSMEDVKKVLQLAKENNLIIMPLIQTFGHMEFVLKFEDKILLRESEYTPQVIDTSSENTYRLLQAMIEQVAKVHGESTHLHIGCDEVYELGRGKSKAAVERTDGSGRAVFLKHVMRVAAMVKEHNLTPVMWDDELRKASLKDFTNAPGFPGSIEIMIWNYTPNVQNAITSSIWEMYSKVFENVWIASAFKGATGPKQFYTEPKFHILNHLSWLQMISQVAGKIEISGIALTGWQRFDHFATLCELLPVGIPSLAVCLATINNGGLTKAIHDGASKRLGCSNLIEVEFPAWNGKNVVVTQDCRFPGYEIYYMMQEYYGLFKRDEDLKKREKGWLSEYQIKHGASNPGILKGMGTKIRKLTINLSESKEKMKTALAKVYFNDTVEEWLDENIDEMMNSNSKLSFKVKKLMEYTSWGKRPFIYNSTVAGGSTKSEESAKSIFNRPIMNHKSGHLVNAAGDLNTTKLAYDKKEPANKQSWLKVRQPQWQNDTKSIQIGRESGVLNGGPQQKKQNVNQTLPNFQQRRQMPAMKLSQVRSTPPGMKRMEPNQARGRQVPLANEQSYLRKSLKLPLLAKPASEGAPLVKPTLSNIQKLAIQSKLDLVHQRDLPQAKRPLPDDPRFASEAIPPQRSPHMSRNQPQVPLAPLHRKEADPKAEGATLKPTEKADIKTLSERLAKEQSKTKKKVLEGNKDSLHQDTKEVEEYRKHKYSMEDLNQPKKTEDVKAQDFDLDLLAHNEKPGKLDTDVRDFIESRDPKAKPAIQGMDRLQLLKEQAKGSLKSFDRQFGSDEREH